mgnify:CR=1 FL=1
MSEIRMEGLDEVFKRIEDISDVQWAQKGLQRASALVERAAKEKAKKGRTGELRRSIKSEVNGLEGIVYSTLLYAPYVEYGTGLFAEGEGGGRTDVPWRYQDDEGNWHTTSGMKPQPFMKPALNESREEVIRLIGEALTNRD